MKRSISSGFTKAYRFIVAPLMAAGCSTDLIMTLNSDGLLLTIGHALAMIPIGIIIWREVQLKCVEIEGDMLRISNFRTEIVVPLAEVGTIKESRFPFPIVRLSFIKDTPFGSRIIFAPTYMFFHRPHPIIDELWELREAALKKA